MWFVWYAVVTFAALAAKICHLSDTKDYIDIGSNSICVSYVNMVNMIHCFRKLCFHK